MIDNTLNPSQSSDLWQLKVELATGKIQVETLLPIGKPLAARVTAVRPEGAPPPPQGSSPAEKNPLSATQTRPTNPQNQAGSGLVYRPTHSPQQGGTAQPNTQATPKQAADIQSNPIQNRPPQTSASQPAPSARPAAPAPTIQPNTTQPAASQAQSGAQLYRINLNVEGKSLEIISRVPLEVGSQVKVTYGSEQRLTLILPHPRQQALQTALRQHLPNQQPPAALTNLLTAVAQNPQPLQSTALIGIVQALFGKLPSPINITPDKLLGQIRDSGLFMENKIAQNQTQTLGATDQKALLLKLAQHLPPPPGGTPNDLNGKLSQAVQQAISRVVVNQLQSLSVSADRDGNVDPARHYVLDLPVYTNGRTENIQLRIQSEHKESKEKHDSQQESWRVQLQFELQELGSLGAEITLQNEQLGVTWFSSREARSVLDTNLQRFEKQLAQADLNLTSLGVREQPLPQPPSPAVSTSLIDITT